MRESLPLLPATAFVWKDELEAGYRKLNCPYRKEIMWEQEGDRELTFSPMMTTEQRAIVLEGFPADEAQEAAAPAMSGAKADTGDCRLTDEEEARLEAHFDSGFSEPVSISWEYWIGHLPKLNAMEASRLMAGLEPHAFEDLATCDQTKGDTAGRVARARKIELLAIREEKTEATPREWLAWAKQRNLNLHSMFEVSVAHRMAQDDVRTDSAGETKATISEQSPPATERRKRQALIDELEGEWPSIEADLREASRAENWLRPAKLPEHGYWDKSVAVKLAVENGKMRSPAPPGKVEYGLAAQLKAATKKHRIR